MMKTKQTILTTFSLLILVGSNRARASDAGAATVKAETPSSGLINDWLREQSSAADRWDIGGQFRTRYEGKQNAGSFPNNDFLDGIENSNDYFLFRTTAHLVWSFSDWFAALVEGRDSHAVSDARPITETDNFDLRQVYLHFADPKRFPFSLKVGRQELSYGDERYIGISDWSNVGRVFDAVKLRFENELFWAEAIAGRQVVPRDEHFNVVNDYDWLLGVYASTRHLVPWQDIDLFFLSRNASSEAPNALGSGIPGLPSSARDIYTAGTRWKSAPGSLGNWDYTLEAAGQFGSFNQSGTRLDHRAFAVNGTGGYTWGKAWATPRVNAGYDFASGDSDPGDSRHETFDLLFGTNHKPYGVMDLFGLRNIHIPRTGVSLKPQKDLTLSLDWLGFWLADTHDFLYPETGSGRNQNGYGRNPSFDSYVGQELDFVVSWRLASWGNLQAGYGHFFAGTYIRQSAAAGGRNAEDADWLYLQAILTF